MPSPGVFRKNLKHGRKRRVNYEANRPQPAAPINITAAAAAGSVLTLTFDQPVSLNGTPGFTTDVAGADPISAAQTAPNVVEITFDAAIAAATAINIPFRDPAIRNSSGGFVVSNTFPV